MREIDGFGRHRDYPHPRLMKDPVLSGPNEGCCIPFADIQFLLDACDKARGWDENGIPTAETPRRCGLSALIPAMDQKR